MPGRVKKVDGFRTIWGGRVTAKNTTGTKAQAQLNLLRGVEHGWVPPKYARRPRRSRTMPDRTRGDRQVGIKR